MARALRLAMLGWACGFLAVVAVGMLRGGQHGSTSLLGPALLAIAVTAALVLAAGARDLRDARRERRWWRAVEVAAARQASRDEALVAMAVADEAAARIAALEARLALEVEQLDAAAIALAEAELIASEEPPEINLVGVAVEDEPVLRAQLVETFAAMVERADETHAAIALRDVETLLEKAG
jgi:hypothetical protein